MSFSASVKKELCSKEVLSDCCLHAQAYGTVLFSHFSKFDISITTENEDTARFYCENLKEACGVQPVSEDPTAKKPTYFVEGTKNKNAVMDAFGHSPDELNLRFIRSNLNEECCVGPFLRGAFMACGTVTDPNKNYHLEFVVPFKKLSTDFITFLSEQNFSPKYIQRKGYHIVYFKESEAIEDILTLMGATESSLALMGVKMQKDVINRVNRRLNFEMSNIAKTVDAAQRQADAIARIERLRGIDFLPENLREIAVLRRDNPEVSLTDLGKLMQEPISRSGVNHRLAKIISIADSLLDEE